MTTATRDMLDTAAVARRVLERDAVADIRGFLRAQQNDDGGFRGRCRESDLYYTVFGAGALLALGRRPAFRLRRYVAGFGDGANLDFVHLACLVRCRSALMMRKARASRLVDRLEEFRSADGSYSHIGKGAETGTAYASYLAMLALEDAGCPLSEPDRLLAAVNATECVGGGFAGGGDAGAATTPGTAAAAMVFHRLSGSVPGSVGKWLLEQAVVSGGFRAAPGAPVADLLSTATALYALRCMDVSIDGIREACLDFVEGLWTECGGFAGHIAEDTADCEYTFYGLLALGCLASPGEGS